MERENIMQPNHGQENRVDIVVSIGALT
jgi:hypothetical protein